MPPALVVGGGAAVEVEEVEEVVATEEEVAMAAAGTEVLRASSGLPPPASLSVSVSVPYQDSKNVEDSRTVLEAASEAVRRHPTTPASAGRRRERAVLEQYARSRRPGRQARTRS